MKKILVVLMFFAISATLTFTSCDGSSNEPPTAINAEQFGKLRESKENAGKRFSITGYPHLNNDITVSNDMAVPIALFAEPNGKGDYIGFVPLGYKHNKNGMYIPDQFTADDLQIFDNEGNQLGVNDKITISFTMKLDTKREPSKGGIKEVKDENGNSKIVDKEPQYFGEGPVKVKVVKAQ